MSDRQELVDLNVIAWAEYKRVVVLRASGTVRKGACIKAIEASDALALHDRETAASMDTQELEAA